MLDAVFVYTDEVDPECDVFDIADDVVTFGDWKETLEEARAYVAKEFPENKKFRFFKLSIEEILYSLMTTNSCIECEEKAREIERLKLLFKKVRPIIGAFAAQASNGPLREARTKIYKEIEDALPKCS